MTPFFCLPGAGSISLLERVDCSGRCPLSIQCTPWPSPQLHSSHRPCQYLLQAMVSCFCSADAGERARVAGRPSFCFRIAPRDPAEAASGRGDLEPGHESVPDGSFIRLKPLAHPSLHHSHGLSQGISSFIKSRQEPRKLLAQIPVFLPHGTAQQPHALLTGCCQLVKRVENQEITACSLEASALQALLKKLLRWREIRKEGAPRAYFSLSCALDHNVEVLFEGGEQ